MIQPGRSRLPGRAGLALLTAGLLGVGASARAEFKVGATLPEFSIKAADGSTFTLQHKKDQVLVGLGTKQLEPKVLILHLFQPDCLQCQAQMRELEKVSQEFGNDGVLVVGIAHRGDAEAARGVAERLKVTFPVLVGTGSDLAKQFAAGDSLAITDRTGVVRFAQVGYGAGDEGVWREDIRRLLAGKAVAQRTVARNRLKVGDRLPVIELSSVTSGKTIALAGAGERLTLRDEAGKVSHPKAAVCFFSRY
jgi:peroxiredoxin